MVSGAALGEIITMVVLLPSVKLSTPLEKSMSPFTVMVSTAAEAANVPLTVRLLVDRSAPERLIVPPQVVSPTTVISLAAALASRVPLVTVRSPLIWIGLPANCQVIPFPPSLKKTSLKSWRAPVPPVSIAYGEPATLVASKVTVGPASKEAALLQLPPTVMLLEFEAAFNWPPLMVKLPFTSRVPVVVMVPPVTWKSQKVSAETVDVPSKPPVITTRPFCGAKLPAVWFQSSPTVI